MNDANITLQNLVDTSVFKPQHIREMNKALEAGADVNAFDAFGRSGLHLSVRSGNTEATQWLLEHGADVNARDGRHARTPLWQAVAEGRPVAELETLVKAGADVNTPDNRGQSPLHAAVLEQRDVAGPNHDHVRYLLSAGANVKALDNEGHSPLAYAALAEKPNLVSHLAAWEAKDQLAALSLPVPTAPRVPSLGGMVSRLDARPIVDSPTAAPSAPRARARF